MKRFNLLTIIVLSLCFITLASAQDLGLKQVGGKLGLIMPEDPFDTGFEIGATANMGELTDNLELFPLISYWFTGVEDFSIGNLQIGGDVHYYIEDVEGLYAGGGLSINFSIPEEGDGDSDIGLGLLGGYQMPIGDFTGFAEAKYNIISDFNTFELCVGIFFDMK